MAEAPTPLAARLALGYAALLLAVWVGVSRWTALDQGGVREAAAVTSRAGADDDRLLDGASAAGVIAALRLAASTGRAPDLAAPHRRWRGLASLYCKGRVVAESAVFAEGAHLDAPALANAFPGSLDAAARAACRLRLDVERGRGPVLAIEPLASLSLVPGYDGLGVTLGDRDVVVGPDELLRTDLLAGHQPLPGVDVEFGLDVPGALRLLALRAGVDGVTWRRTPHRLFRVRYESWLEPLAHDASGAPAAPGAAAGHALPLQRYHSPAPPLSRQALRGAAEAAAAYLLRHLRPDGHFEYLYEPLADQVIPDGDDYSLPRHSGAAWYLAQAGGALGRRDLVEGAGRALAWLRDHTAPACNRPAWACAGTPGERTADLGSAALALLAATEYRRVSGDDRFDPWARRLAAFLRAMQRDDGDFRHVYDLELDHPDERARLLYYSGEAAYALARFASDPGTSADERRELAGRADRALRWLAVDNYAYFAGGFFFGEDHWTCIAADEAWELVGPESSRERWSDFCEGFAGFLGRSRFSDSEGPVREQPDLVGAYGFTGLVAPHPTPVGSRSESLVSVYRLALRRGHQQVADAIARGVKDSMRFLLAHQIRREDAWMMPDPDAALGGFSMSDVKPVIRIDFPQHAGSSMLRAAEIGALAGDPGPATAP